MDAEKHRSECVFPDGARDAYGCMAFADFVRYSQDCELVMPDAGLCFQMVSTIHDKHGHKLDGDHDPAGAHGCDHRDTPEWKVEHPRKAPPKKETPVKESIQIQEPAAAEAPTTAIVAQPPTVPTTTATVGVDAAVNQMKSLLPAGADPALMVGGAAGLAVIGAAIKFGPSVLKARAQKAEREHEEKMRKLELEEKKADQQDDKHQQCTTARVALEARVVSAEQKTAAVEAKLAEVVAKAEKAGGSSIDLGDFDPDELEERLTKIEKAMKPAKAAKKRK
jgi:hypothetical protein